MPKPIRVLQIFTILNRGGAESMIMNYYRKLNRELFQFDFLVHREEEGIFEEEIRTLGGRIFRLPSINPLFPEAYYKRFREFLRENPYKIIHSHINTFSYFPLKVAKELNVPVRISHAHTTTKELTAQLWFQSPKEALKIWFKTSNKEKVSLVSNHLFSCGIEAGKWLYNEKEFTILPNAIDLDHYIFNQDQAMELKRKFGLQDSFVVGHVGNFSYPKNYPFILEVFAEMLKMEPTSKLLLVGMGQMYEQIKRKTIELGINASVVFLGSRNDVPQLLQIMDVFIFPSHYEGLPVTLVEAQASGIPILASSNISNEVAISKNIEFLSLTQNPIEWAKRLLFWENNIRKSSIDEVRDNNYDIVQNTRFLEQFYLEKIKNNEG